MAIIQQQIEESIIRKKTVTLATTIADAVRIDPACDYVTNNLVSGKLKDALIDNRISTAHSRTTNNEYMRMLMCMKHGRLFQAA